MLAPCRGNPSSLLAMVRECIPAETGRARAGAARRGGTPLPRGGAAISGNQWRSGSVADDGVDLVVDLGQGQPRIDGWQLDRCCHFIEALQVPGPVVLSQVQIGGDSPTTLATIRLCSSEPPAIANTSPATCSVRPSGRARSASSQSSKVV